MPKPVDQRWVDPHGESNPTHAMHRLIVIGKLRKAPWIRHKTATPTTTNTQHNSTYRKL